MSFSVNIPVVCLVLMSAVQAVAVDRPLGGYGYRYDGTGLVDPSYRPPTSNLKLRWKVPTANWGYSCPTEVGDQVLVLCEAGSEDVLFPTLVSYDRATGKERWRATIDPLQARGVGDAERKQIEDDMRYWHEMWRFLYTTSYPFPEADQAGREAINATLSQKGFRINSYKNGYGLLRDFDRSGNKRFSELYDKYRKQYGLGRYSWLEFSDARVGQAFPTPVSDGKHIIVTTDHAVVACLDMSGTIKWIKATDYRPTMGNVGSSPRIVDGKAIINMSSKTYAYDLESGEVLWTVGAVAGKHVNGHGVYSSPLIVELDGTVVVIDAKSRVIRLSDGHWFDLVTHKGEAVTATFSKAGGSSELKNQLVTPGYVSFNFDRSTQEFYASGKHFTLYDWVSSGRKAKPGQPLGGHGGYKLSLSGDIVTVTPSQPKLMTGSVGVPYKSKVYLTKQIFDRASGESTFQGKKNPDQAPNARSIFMLANEHVYGMAGEHVKKGSGQKGGCMVTVYDLTGKKTGQFIMPWIDPESDANVRKAFDQGITKPSYCCPMNIGRDCIYTRDPYYLYCIAD